MRHTRKWSTASATSYVRNQSARDRFVKKMPVVQRTSLTIASPSPRPTRQVDVTPPPVATTDEEEMQYLNQLLAEVHSDLARRLDDLDLSSPASPMRRGGAGAAHDSCADLGSATHTCAEIDAELALEDDLFWEEEIRKRLLERQDEAIAREILRAEQEAVVAETAARRAKRGEADQKQIAADEAYAQELHKFEKDIASGKIPPPPSAAPQDEEDAPPAPPAGLYEGKENDASEGKQADAKALVSKMKRGAAAGTAAAGTAGAGAKKKDGALAAVMKRCYSWQARQTTKEGGSGAMQKLKAAARNNRGLVRKLMTRMREQRQQKRLAKAQRKADAATKKREAAEERARNKPYVAVDGTLVFPKAAVLCVSAKSNKK